MKQYIPKGPIGQKESWEIGKYFEMNENEDTVAEFMDTVKAVSEGNFHPEMPILKKKYLKSGT